MAQSPGQDERNPTDSRQQPDKVEGQAEEPLHEGRKESPQENIARNEPFSRLPPFATRQGRDARTEYEEYEIYRRRRRKKRTPTNGRAGQSDQYGRERELERGTSTHRDRARSVRDGSRRGKEQKSEPVQPNYEGIGLYDAQGDRTREWANGQSNTPPSQAKGGKSRRGSVADSGAEEARDGQKHSRYDDERSRATRRSSHHEHGDGLKKAAVAGAAGAAATAAATRVASRAGTARQSQARTRRPLSEDYFSDDYDSRYRAPRRRNSYRPTEVTNYRYDDYSPDRRPYRGRSRADSYFTRSTRPRSPGDPNKPLYGPYRQPSVDPRHDPHRPSEGYTPLKAAKAAAISAVVEALRCRSEPGPWKGQKAKRIALAASVGTVIGALRSGRLQNSGNLPYAESAITGFYAVDFMKRVCRQTEHTKEAYKEQREWREEAARREDDAQYGRRRYSR